MSKIGVWGSLGIMIVCLAGAICLVSWQQDNILKLWSNITGATQVEMWSIMYYDRDGHELLEEPISVQYNVETGDISGFVSVPQAPIIEGYTWVDWEQSIDEDAKQISYTATYEAIMYTYTITHYDIDGLQIGDATTATGDYGGALTTEVVHPEAPIIDDVAFVGWIAADIVAGDSIMYCAMYGTDYYNYYYDMCTAQIVYEPTDASSEVSVLDNPLTLVLSQEPSSDTTLSPPTTITDYTAPVYVEIYLYGGLGDGSAVDIAYTCWLEHTANGSSGDIVISDEITWHLTLDSTNKLSISNLVGNYDNLTVDIVDIRQILPNTI